MPKRFAWSFVVPVLFSLLVGCATAPRGPLVAAHEEVTAPEKVIYRMPKSADVVMPKKRVIYVGKFYDSEFRGLYLPAPSEAKSESGGDREHRTAYSNTSAKYISYEFDKGVLKCGKWLSYTLGTGARWASYTRYNLSVSMEERGDEYLITLLPTSIDRKGDKSLTVNLGVPPFTTEELYTLLSKPHVVFKFEINSEYDEKATLANFRRLLGEPGKAWWSGKPSFHLKSASHPAEIAVELWPYRTGSKVVVEVDVELSPTATEPGVRTINVQPFMDEVKKEVEAVIKS